jgi:hypothetical protein
MGFLDSGIYEGPIAILHPRTDGQYNAVVVGTWCVIAFGAASVFVNVVVFGFCIYRKRRKLRKLLRLEKEDFEKGYEGDMIEQVGGFCANAVGMTKRIPGRLEPLRPDPNYVGPLTYSDKLMLQGLTADATLKNTKKMWARDAGSGVISDRVYSKWETEKCLLFDMKPAAESVLKPPPSSIPPNMEREELKALKRVMNGQGSID